jgi:hypothetical protein
MRYVVELQIMFRDEQYPVIRDTLRIHGVDVPDSPAEVKPRWLLRVRVEQADPRLQQILRALETVGEHPPQLLVPSFEPWELEQAEFVRLRIMGFCGDPLAMAPDGAYIMDKRAMGKQDIAKTYAHNQFVISERLREIFVVEGLTGWTATPIRHANEERDRSGGRYLLTATSTLPPLAPETQLEFRRYDDPPEGWKHLRGTTALFERGPLTYRRRDLSAVSDVNRTHEVFLEATVAHPYFILSQRARQAFLKHRVRGDIRWEPVVILE